MTKTRFMLLLAATALLGLFLAAGVRAEPPGGEGEGGEKTPFVRAAAPGAKHNFLFGFLEKARPAFEQTARPALQECGVCGQVTTGEICAFCKLSKLVRDRKA